MKRFGTEARILVGFRFAARSTETASCGLGHWSSQSHGIPEARCTWDAAVEVRRLYK
jgi:hypothetical protein